jgi:hypothetical protein
MATDMTYIRICIADSSWQLDRVYFLAFLNPSRDNRILPPQYAFSRRGTSSSAPFARSPRNTRQASPGEHLAREQVDDLEQHPAS